MEGAVLLCGFTRSVKRWDSSTVGVIEGASPHATHCRSVRSLGGPAGGNALPLPAFVSMLPLSLSLLGGGVPVVEEPA